MFITMTTHIFLDIIIIIIIMIIIIVIRSIYSVQNDKVTAQALQKIQGKNDWRDGSSNVSWQQTLTMPIVLSLWYRSGPSTSEMTYIVSGAALNSYSTHPSNDGIIQTFCRPSVAKSQLLIYPVSPNHHWMSESLIHNCRFTRNSNAKYLAQAD